MQFHKTAARFTAGLLLVSTLISPALAVTGTVDTGSSYLRLRAGSSTKASVLKSLASGTEVEVLSAADNGWYQVSHKGTVGYVSGKYLEVDEAALAAELEAKAAAEAAEAAPEAEAAAQSGDAKQYARVTTSSLNVRSGPGTSYKKVDSLRAGKVVEILDTADGWYKIDSGYISAKYTIAVSADEASSSPKGQEIVDYALTFLGCPYVYGGSTPKGFDCSGFTKYVYAHFGYTLNRTASAQLDNGTPVSMSELQPGDLVLFKKSGTGSKRASHVGIYIGGGQFVHASSPKVDTIISNLSDSYYTTGFVGGRRILGS